MPPVAKFIVVLGFIKKELREGQPFPTSTQISKHMGWKGTTRANAATATLLRWGFIKRLSTPVPRQATQYELTDLGRGELTYEETEAPEVHSRKRRIRNGTVAPLTSIQRPGNVFKKAVGETGRVPGQLGGDQSSDP